MSDFDKEAERERLREKYEQEQREREVTERMSELLLQGATMTNAHCSNCADPIFRYDGQEFCPTCEKPVDRGGDAADGATDEGSGTGGADPGDEQIEVTAPSDEARVRFGGDATEADDAADAGDGDAGSPPSDQRDASTETARQSADPSPAAAATTDRDRSSDERHGRAATPDAGASGDLAAADASLSRTVAGLARRAEESEDLGRTRDLLAATREAAEALGAVRDADR